jgi:hypothetical protein
MIPEDKCPDLANPVFFDNIQKVYNSTDVKQFTTRQTSKFLFLYNLFYRKQKLLKDTNTSIENIANYMNKKKLPKAAVIGLRSGVQIIISLLREVCSTNT